MKELINKKRLNVFSDVFLTYTVVCVVNIVIRTILNATNIYQSSWMLIWSPLIFLGCILGLGGLVIIGFVLYVYFSINKRSKNK